VYSGRCFKYLRAVIRCHEILNICRRLVGHINTSIHNYNGANDFVLSKAHIFALLDCDSIWDSISSWRFFRRRDSEHSKSINQFFIHAKTLEIIKIKNKADLRTREGLSVAQLPFMTHAIAHLENYTNIRQNWEDLNDTLSVYNGFVDRCDILLRSRLRTELAKRENYPKHIAIYSNPTSYLASEDRCYIPSMVNCLYTYLSSYQYEGRLITDFTYYKTSVGERTVLRNEEQNILIESTKETDSEKDKLINIYNTVIEQDDVKQTFIDLKQASDKMNSLIKLFTSGVRILSEDIELGRVIKDKCSVGY
jgi:hypothetical protein